MNKCGECGTCCKACKIDAIKKPANVICWFYKDDIGCSIYKDRPNDCKTYQCVWITQDNIDVKYRPDQLGVLFEQPKGQTYWVGIELVPEALLTADCAALVSAMNNDGACVMLKNIKGEYQYSLPPEVDTDSFLKEFKG